MEQTAKTDAGIRHDPEFPGLYKRNQPDRSTRSFTVSVSVRSPIDGRAPALNDQR